MKKDMIWPLYFEGFTVVEFGLLRVWFKSARYYLVPWVVSQERVVPSQHFFPMSSLLAIAPKPLSLA